MKALVVEDDATSRLILQKTLSRFAEVHTAKDGRQGIEAFVRALTQEQPYQLICLDIMMPGMDGLEVLRRIRAVEKEQSIPAEDRVKIVMTTAKGDKDSVMTAIKNQCDAYVLKPYDPKQIMERLQEIGFRV